MCFLSLPAVMIMLMVEDAELKKQEVMNDRRFEPKTMLFFRGTAMVLVRLYLFSAFILF